MVTRKRRHKLNERVHSCAYDVPISLYLWVEEKIVERGTIIYYNWGT